jgi:filamentous hemagglutinin family protein
MLLSLMPSLPTEPVTTYPINQIAQVIPADDGTGTVVRIDGNIFNINQGTRQGANLFQSFEQFGLSRGQVANFQISAEVANIVGRVVGGDESTIDGVIRVSSGSANLFLVNPSGIIFGPTASLDLRGSFTASTSDRLGSDNWQTNWNSQLFAPPNNPNSVVFTVGAPATRPGSPPGLSFGSEIHLTNGAFVSGDLTFPGNDITITGGSITTGHINTASRPGGTVTLVALIGGISTGNISTQGAVTAEDDGLLRLEDGSIRLTSVRDISTGEIEVFKGDSSAPTDTFQFFNGVLLTSTTGGITVHSIRSGSGGISISAPLGLFRAEGAVPADLDFQTTNRDQQPRILNLSLQDNPALVTFLEAQGLTVVDPETNEPYPTTIQVVFPDCSGSFCEVPTSLRVIVDNPSQLSGESLIRVEHRGQSVSAEEISIEGAGSNATPAFVAGPIIAAENPQLWSGNVDSFDPNQPQQSFILSVSPSFSALNLTSELPSGVSGTVGGIFITFSNATVISSISNRPFVPSTDGNGGGGNGNGGGGNGNGGGGNGNGGGGGNGNSGGGNGNGGGGNGNGGGGNGNGITQRREISTAQIGAQSQSEVAVPSSVFGTPLLSISEDARTMPCSASELTLTEDGRYVLSGCAP